MDLLGGFEVVMYMLLMDMIEENSFVLERRMLVEAIAV